VDIPAVYKNLFVYDVALELGEIIDDRSPEFRVVKLDKMRYLQERLRDEDSRMERWRRSQRGKGPNRRRAFNDRSPGIHFTPRKFTVRFD
jgi:hypothetical protein